MWIIWLDVVAGDPVSAIAVFGGGSFGGDGLMMLAICCSIALSFIVAPWRQAGFPF